jgi:glycine/D-amino acid oxidase-like deaminating enzyme
MRGGAPVFDARQRRRDYACGRAGPGRDRNQAMRVAVLGAGLQGTCAALELAARGCWVDLYEREPSPISQASRWNEGKIHLGFVFANDDPARSARMLALGSLHFRAGLSRWIDTRSLEGWLSEPFHYVVHRDSMLSPEAIEAHFDAVAAQLGDLEDGLGLSYLGRDKGALFKRVLPAEFERHYDGRAVQAVYRTVERSIDPRLLAERLTDALWLEPRINFLPGYAVERVERCRRGALSVVVSGPARSHQGYSHVVNALWSDRLRIDATIGIRPIRPWLFRRKLAVHLQHASAEQVPSTTMVLGPFGDVVSFDKERMYLSWYPACRVASTDALAPSWRDRIDEEQGRAVLDQTVEGLATVIPSLSRLSLNGGTAKVEGGTIFGWGSTDITDLGSELHQRFDIGVHSYGNYHSVDTGKYCMAPYFALEVGRRVRAHRRWR